MNKIVIIGLGPGSEKHITLEGYSNLKSGRKTYLRTNKHPVVAFLRDENIEFETYDRYYEESKLFSDVYENIVLDLLEKLDKYGDINYCVPGHPLVAEKTVELLLQLKREDKIEVEIVQGLSFIEPIISLLEIDIVDGIKIIDGLDLKNQKVDISIGNLVTQVYSKEKASELKLDISDIYGDEYLVYILKSAGIPEDEKVLKTEIYNIDKIEWIDHLTSIYIPKIEKKDKIYDFNSLLKIMEELRGENGCPWDINQTNDSLKKYVIEEAYELIDAIDNEDIEGIIEELGDVLLQVVFHSQIGKEEGYFTIVDVINGISLKMVNRHPHVFSNKKIDGEESLKNSWEEIKSEEKNYSSIEEKISVIPKSLPSLIRSEKIQKKIIGTYNLEKSLKDITQKIISNIKNIEEVENKEKYFGEILSFITILAIKYDVNLERALYDRNNYVIEEYKKSKQNK